MAKAGNCQTARQRRPIFNANDYHVRQYKNKLQPPTKKEKIRSSDRIWEIEGMLATWVSFECTQRKIMKAKLSPKKCHNIAKDYL